MLSYQNYLNEKKFEIDHFDIEDVQNVAFQDCGGIKLSDAEAKKVMEAVYKKYGRHADSGGTYKANRSGSFNYDKAIAAEIKKMYGKEVD